MFTKYIIYIGLLFFCGCKTANSVQKSELRDIVRNRNAKNIALVLGAPRNLPGVPFDVISAEKMIKEDFKEQNFEVVRIDKVHKDQLLEELARAAKDVGYTGTLLLYFSGHGAVGSIAVEDEIVTFEEIASSVRKDRQTELARFIVILDTCHSGSASVFGQAASTSPIGKSFLESVQNFNSVMDSNFPQLIRLKTQISRLKKYHFEIQTLMLPQTIVFSSSGSSEVSLDQVNGGAYTKSFTKNVRKLRENNFEHATIEMLSDLLIQDLEKIQHPALVTAPSKDIQKNLIFKNQPDQQNSSDVMDKIANQARLDWGKEVESEVNRQLVECQFAIESLDPEPADFFFSPTFKLSSNGSVISQLYLGTFNWMSDPKVSADVIVESLSKRKIGPFKCQTTTGR